MTSHQISRSKGHIRTVDRRTFCKTALAGALHCSSPAFAFINNPSPGNSPASFNLSVLPEITGHIGPEFCGLSYEKSHVATHLFRADNQELVRLFRQLGSGVLRVGGNLVDQTHWNPKGPGATPGSIAPSDVDHLASFAKQAGWKVLYGVNLAQSTPHVAADEVAYAQKVLGTSLAGIEIGNEPDLYVRSKYFPEGWGYAGYITRWRLFADAILQRSRSVPLTGPATAFDTTWFAAFAVDAAERIRLLTHHYYRADGRLPSSDVNFMVSLPDAKLAKVLPHLQDAAQNVRLPFRMAETNSYFNGGAPHVSDAYASALWVIDHLFHLAEGGCSGANLHGGNHIPYTPIADTEDKVTEIRPEYYGLYLFTQAGQGGLRRCSIDNKPDTLSAYAVDCGRGKIKLVVSNKDVARGITISIDVGRPITGAEAILLSNKSLSATQGTTIQGKEFTPGQSFTAPGAHTLNISQGKAAYILPPISAALIELT